VEEVLHAAQDKLPEVCVQMVDLDKVAGSRYLLLATYNALKSFRSKQPISRTLSMEILLYVSANRQINEALRRSGVTADTRETAVIAVGQSYVTVAAAKDLLEQLMGMQSSDGLLDFWSAHRIKRVQKNLDIARDEVLATIRDDETMCEAIERLAIEKSALLAVRR